MFFSWLACQDNKMPFRIFSERHFVDMGYVASRNIDYWLFAEMNKKGTAVLNKKGTAVLK